jgi:hypothetical protein
MAPMNFMEISFVVLAAGFIWIILYNVFGMYARGAS